MHAPLAALLAFLLPAAPLLARPPADALAKLRDALAGATLVEERETFRFARAGDRLVAVRSERERRGQGAGEKGERKSTTTLDLAQ